jgi:hypothetical protein
MTERPAERGEGKLAASWQNKAIGRALRAARLALGEGSSKQAAFAARLSRDLQMPLSATAVSNWESGRRTVPGAVLLAAATAASESMDALLGESGEPKVVTWVEGLGLPQRLRAQEAELHSLRNQMGDLQRIVADLQVASMDEASARPTGDLGESGGPRRRASGQDV